MHEIIHIQVKISTPDLPHVKNVRHIMKLKIQQRRPVEQLKSYIKHEWEIFSLLKLQPLGPSVVSVPNAVVIRQVVNMANVPLSQLFCKTLQASCSE